MEPAHTLSAVAAVEPAPPRRRARRLWPLVPLLAASLAINAVLAAAAWVVASRLQAQLAQLTAGAERSAQQLEQHAAGLAALEAQARAVDTGLEDVRKAVWSHAREESLFLKMLILKPGLDHQLAHRIAASVQRECMLTGQDPNLVLAIMAVESDFNPKAISNQGATGLMQVMPHWRKVLGLSDLTEPETSIRAGIQILGYYQQMYRDLDLAITAYNRGPGPVDFALVKQADPSNGYAAKVLALAGRLKTIDVAARP